MAIIISLISEFSSLFRREFIFSFSGPIPSSGFKTPPKMWKRPSYLPVLSMAMASMESSTMHRRVLLRVWSIQFLQGLISVIVWQMSQKVTPAFRSVRAFMKELISMLSCLRI